jgi:homocysteine S-methyltransferase
MTPANPIRPFLERQGVVILDGGLATELERHGADLSGGLWSAWLLREDPALIRRVHADYYWAGSDCSTSASYQATIPGFMARGMSESEAEDLLLYSVRLAAEARDEFWANTPDRERRLRPLVAASVGPYGAYLADGSEYTGDYDLDEEGLVAFHRRRWHLLAGSDADLLAVETIPSATEARALARLLAETPEAWAWFSFSCRDGRHISDGTPLADCAAALGHLDRVVAVGINCTAPRFIPDLIREVARVTDKPIVVYPNSGEAYDPVGHCWIGESVPSEFGTYSREWRKLGAALIGGCCRTGPDHIRQISDRFRKRVWQQ